MDTTRDVEVVRDDLRHARVGFDAGPGQTIEITNRVGADEIIGTWEQAVDSRLDPRHGVICAW